METGDIVARVVEGRVNKVNVVHVDDEGNPRKGKGEVAPDIILRELPFKVPILRPRLKNCGFDMQSLPICCNASLQLLAMYGLKMQGSESFTGPMSVTNLLLCRSLDSCTMLKTGERR